MGAGNNVPKSGRSDPRWTCIVPNTLLYSTHNVFNTTHFNVTNVLYSTVRTDNFFNCSNFVKLTVLRLKMPFEIDCTLVCLRIVYICNIHTCQWFKHNRKCRTEKVRWGAEGLTTSLLSLEPFRHPECSALPGSGSPKISPESVFIHVLIAPL